MDAMKTCPNCHKPLAPNAPDGLCPECLVKAGLPTGADIERPTGQTSGTAGPHGTKILKPPPPLEEIARHFPQFQILECLGRGGMGVVYKARQPKLNRFVALKILAPEKVAETRFAERFEREAQALARLNHPNIVTVHDFGEANGLYYLLMEYVDGVSLRQLLQTGKIPPEEALAFVPKVCEALQFAHEQGVVHRDIKPENVLLDKQGRVKIADFGIAKIVEGADQPLTPGLSPSDGERVSGRTGEGSLTQDQVLGTPDYMAPEQVAKPQLVDHRADIYSLGVVFYEMLTGELPQGKFQPPSKKVQVDVRLDEVVLHALEKEPERRYQHASEVKSDVETIATTPASANVPQPTVTPTELERGRWLIVVRALGMCIAATVFGIHLRPSSLGIAVAAWGIVGFMFVAWKSLGSDRGKAEDRTALKLANQAGLVHAIGVGRNLTPAP
jgi:serine/threonine protein kinase